MLIKIDYGYYGYCEHFRCSIEQFSPNHNTKFNSFRNFEEISRFGHKSLQNHKLKIVWEIVENCLFMQYLPSLDLNENISKLLRNSNSVVICLLEILALNISRVFGNTIRAYC